MFDLPQHPAVAPAFGWMHHPHFASLPIPVTGHVVIGEKDAILAREHLKSAADFRSVTLELGARFGDIRPRRKAWHARANHRPDHLITRGQLFVCPVTVSATRTHIRNLGSSLQEQGS